MLEILLVLFVVFLIVGYIQIPGLVIPNFTLFFFNGREVSAIDFIIFSLIVAAIAFLPTPFRQIAFGLLIFWLLTTFNVLAVPGLGLIIVIGVILSIAAAISDRRGYFGRGHTHTHIDE